jgi:transposase
MTQVPKLWGVAVSKLYWLSEGQMVRLCPFFPKSHGVPRVDDRRALNCIVYQSQWLALVRRSEGVWPRQDALKPSEAVGRHGVFARMMEGFPSKS